MVINILDFIGSSAPFKQRSRKGTGGKTNKELVLNGLEQCVGTSHQVCCLRLSPENVVTAGVMAPILFGKNCSLGGYLDLSLASSLSPDCSQESRENAKAARDKRKDWELTRKGENKCRVKFLQSVCWTVKIR